MLHERSEDLTKFSNQSGKRITPRAFHVELCIYILLTYVNTFLTKYIWICQYLFVPLQVERVMIDNLEQRHHPRTMANT